MNIKDILLLLIKFKDDTTKVSIVLHDLVKNENDRATLLELLYIDNKENLIDTFSTLNIIETMLKKLRRINKEQELSKVSSILKNIDNGVLKEYIVNVYTNNNQDMKEKLFI